MFDLLGKTVAKLFGTKSERDIKEVLPYVRVFAVESYEKGILLIDGKFCREIG